MLPIDLKEYIIDKYRSKVSLSSSVCCEHQQGSRMFPIKLALLFLAFGFAFGNPVSGVATLDQQEKEDDLNLSPVDNSDSESLTDLVEVKENEIPDGALVYVVEESDQPNVNGESLETSNNIAFRPLFRYRQKQELSARRRSSNAARRRYYVSRRPYRQAYYYPRYRYNRYRRYYY